LLPGLLTKKFINLLQGAEDGALDLNKAAETLEVCVVINTYPLFFLYCIPNLGGGVKLLDVLYSLFCRCKRGGYMI
jgi:hypothetical protein